MAERFIPVSELVRRLNLYLPVDLEGLVDPLGNVFSIRRENIMTLLTVDFEALPTEVQSTTPFFVEMARVQRTFEFATEQLEARYRTWKSERAQQLREMYAEEEGKKKPTKEEIESFYRTHKEYEEMTMAPKSMAVLARLFGDLKEAFRQKSQAQKEQSQFLRGYEQTLRYEDQQQRVAELERLEELEKEAAEAVERSGSAKAAYDYVTSLQES